MNNHEEELQRKVEDELEKTRSTDVEAYRRVFSALRQPLPFTPTSLADRVARRVVLANARKEAFRDHIWLVSGIALFLAGFAYTLYVVDLRSLFQFKPLESVRFNFIQFDFLPGNAGLFVFGSLFVLFLHFLDRRLIRPLR